MTRRLSLDWLDRWVVKVRVGGKLLALAIAALVPSSARLFYASGSVRFAVEQRIVARGIRQYCAADEPLSLYESFRRYIHRLANELAMYDRYVTARAASDELAQLPGPAGATTQRPYPARVRPVNDIDFAALAKLCRQRRSVQWLTTTAVVRTLLEQTIAAAALALTDTERIVLMIAVGHPDTDGLVPYSCKAGR